MSPVSGVAFDAAPIRSLHGLGSREAIIRVPDLVTDCCKSARRAAQLADDEEGWTAILDLFRASLARAYNAVSPALPSAVNIASSHSSGEDALKQFTQVASLILLVLPLSQPMRNAVRLDASSVLNPACAFLDECATVLGESSHSNALFDASVAFTAAGVLGDILALLCRPCAKFTSSLVDSNPKVGHAAAWLATGRSESGKDECGIPSHCYPFLALALSGHDTGVIVGDSDAYAECRDASARLVVKCADAICGGALSPESLCRTLRLLGSMVGICDAARKTVVSHERCITAVIAIVGDNSVSASVRAAGLEFLTFMCVGTNEYKERLITSPNFVAGVCSCLSRGMGADGIAVKMACGLLAAATIASPAIVEALCRSKEISQVITSLARVLADAVASPYGRGHMFSAAHVLSFISRVHRRLVMDALVEFDIPSTLCRMLDSERALIAAAEADVGVVDDWEVVFDETTTTREVALRLLCSLVRPEYDGVKELVSKKAFMEGILACLRYGSEDDRRWALLLCSRIVSHAPAARCIATMGILQAMIGILEAPVSRRTAEASALAMGLYAGGDIVGGISLGSHVPASTAAQPSSATRDIPTPIPGGNRYEEYVAYGVPSQFVSVGDVRLDIVVFTSGNVALARLPTVSVVLEALYECSKSEIMRPFMVEAGVGEKIAPYSVIEGTQYAGICMLIDAHLAVSEEMSPVRAAPVSGQGDPPPSGLASSPRNARKSQSSTKRSSKRFGTIIEHLCMCVREIMTGKRRDFVAYMRGFDTNAAGCLEALRAVTLNESCGEYLQPIVDLVVDCLKLRVPAFLALPGVAEQLSGLAWNIAFHKEWQKELTSAGETVVALKSFATESDNPRVKRNASGALWSLGVRLSKRGERSRHRLVASPGMAAGATSTTASGRPAGESPYTVRSHAPSSVAPPTPTAAVKEREAAGSAPADPPVRVRTFFGNARHTATETRREVTLPRQAQPVDDLAASSAPPPPPPPVLGDRTAPTSSGVRSPDAPPPPEVGAAAAAAATMRSVIVERTESKEPSDIRGSNSSSEVDLYTGNLFEGDSRSEISLGSVGAADDVPTTAAPAHVTTTVAGGHIMISYNWTHQSTALRIRDRLVADGLPVWIDVSDIQGSTLEAMASAVEDAAVILLLCSSQYQESIACRTEAEYTYTLRRPFIPVVVQRGLQMRTWLGAMVGSRLYHPLYEDLSDADFAVKMDGLIREIRLKLNSGAVSTVQLAPPIHSGGVVNQPSSGPTKQSLTASELSNDAVPADTDAGKHIHTLHPLDSDENVAAPHGESSLPSFHTRDKGQPIGNPTSMNMSVPVAEWTVDDVALWLRSVGMASYASDFKDSGMSGLSLQELYSLVRSGNDLEFGRILREDVGIKSAGVVLEFKGWLRTLFGSQTRQIGLGAVAGKKSTEAGGAISQCVCL